jgi:hypothetical protein
MLCICIRSYIKLFCNWHFNFNACSSLVCVLGCVDWRCYTRLKYHSSNGFSTFETVVRIITACSSFLQKLSALKKHSFRTTHTTPWEIKWHNTTGSVGVDFRRTNLSSSMRKSSASTDQIISRKHIAFSWTAWIIQRDKTVCCKVGLS